MDGSAAPLMTRRLLHDGGALRVGYLVSRPTSPECIDAEAPAGNVLVFPLKGVFARHPSKRRNLVATANHVVALPANQPYRLSFPGCIGDEVLVLQWSREGLAARLPGADERFTAMAESHDLLSPRQMIRRSRLARRLMLGEFDALEVEEQCAELLASCLRVDEPRPAGRRRLEDVKLAIGLDPIASGCWATSPRSHACRPITWRTSSAAKWAPRSTRMS
ncbi:hypothetical protein BWI17_05070 [Betaproteobacteria bacterium GR16-43]|nr:hypothetical protein BWI17_05070 [Betaproteobacteria bacterium GR16-43]